MHNDKGIHGPVAAVHTIALVLVALLVASCSASSTTIAAAEPQATASTEDSPGTDADPDEADDRGEEVEANNEPTPTPDPPPTEAADNAAADDTADGTADDADDADNSASANDTVAAGEAVVVLLDAGAEPRTELRMMIAPSCGEVMTFRQLQEINQSLDGTPSSGSVGNVMEMATSATRNGDNYEVRTEVLSAGAAPGTPADLAAVLDVELVKLIGLTTFATMSDRGVQIPGTVRVEGGEALGPLGATVEAVAQTQAPLPIEAVGVGARWETTSAIDVQGLAVVTTTESEIVAIDGTIVKLLISGSQEVAVGSEMNVQGITAEVTEWTSVTTGEITVDLATISPISSSAVTEATQGFDFGASGSLHQTIHSEVLVTGAPDDGCTGRTQSR